MAFTRSGDFRPFEKKVWLASPTMHGEELEFVTEAYETNWMSTVGENINQVEKIAAQRRRSGMPSVFPAVPRHFICAVSWQERNCTGNRPSVTALWRERGYSART